MVKYLIIRNAEENIIDSSNNTNLSAFGIKRTKHLLKLVSNISIDKVYYTKGSKASFQTASPIIKYFNCEAIPIDPNDILPFFLKSLENDKNKTVIIVSEINHIPLMLNCFKLDTIFTKIDDKEYDNLFVVAARNNYDFVLKNFKY